MVGEAGAGGEAAALRWDPVPPPLPGASMLARASATTPSPSVPSCLGPGGLCTGGQGAASITGPQLLHPRAWLVPEKSREGTAGDGGLGDKCLAVAMSGSSWEGGCPIILVIRLVEKDLPIASQEKGSPQSPREGTPCAEGSRQSASFDAPTTAK